MLTDQERLESLQQYVERLLQGTGMDEGRAAYLSNHENVLLDLPGASVDDWDLVLATAVHLVPPYIDDHNLYGAFSDEIAEHAERLVVETGDSRPALRLDWGEPRLHHPFNARWSTYIFSRIVMGLLVEETDPEFAIGLHESVSTLFLPFVSDELSSVPLWLAPNLVRTRLGVLYERVGRYEDALSLLVPPPQIGWTQTGTDQFLPIVRNFDGWLEQLSKQDGPAETLRLLDIVYRLIQRVDGIDQKERDQLSDCPPNTRQFWAWYYGWALGRIVATKPFIRTSLLEELDAGEWSDGWPAAGILMGSPPDSWQDFRQWALRLYQMADIEYRRDGGLPQIGIWGPSWGPPQPPHLSPQSDLYWAMRAGFADAHLELVQGPPVSLRDIADRLERVQSIVSSSALHTLRTGHGVELLRADVERGLPPADEYWEQLIHGILADSWEVLTKRTKSYLVTASTKRHAKEWDEQRVALA